MSMEKDEFAYHAGYNKFENTIIGQYENALGGFTPGATIAGGILRRLILKEGFLNTRSDRIYCDIDVFFRNPICIARFIDRIIDLYYGKIWSSHINLVYPDKFHDEWVYYKKVNKEYSAWSRNLDFNSIEYKKKAEELKILGRQTRSLAPSLHYIGHKISNEMHKKSYASIHQNVGCIDVLSMDFSIIPELKSRSLTDAWTAGRIALQLVIFETWPTIPALFNSFNYTCNQWAYDGEKIYYTVQAMWDGRNKILRPTETGRFGHKSIYYLDKMRGLGYSLDPDYNAKLLADNRFRNSAEFVYM